MDGVNIGKVSIPALVGKPGIDGKTGIIKDIIIKILKSTEKPFATNTGTETEAVFEIGIPGFDNISSININKDSDLIFTFDSSKEINAGNCKGTGILNIKIVEGVAFFTLTDGSEINAGNILSKENIEELKKYSENFFEKTNIAISNLEIDEIVKL